MEECTMSKGKSFVEIFFYALNEDYRFPVLEIFAFLFTLSAFFFVNFPSLTAQGISSEEVIAFGLVNSLAGTPLFILVFFFLKNIAFDLGNELEKGVIQTFFSYPLSRRLLLTAKLLSSLGVAVLLFLGVQIFALFVLTPEIVSSYLSIILVTYIAALTYPLLIAGLALLLAIFLKRGDVAILFGIILYFSFMILGSFIALSPIPANEFDPFRLGFSIINPMTALQYHYQIGVPQFFDEVWTPTFTEALLYIGAGYFLVGIVFAVGYYYFERKLEV